MVATTCPIRSFTVPMTSKLPPQCCSEEDSFFQTHMGNNTTMEANPSPKDPARASGTGDIRCDGRSESSGFGIQLGRCAHRGTLSIPRTPPNPTSLSDGQLHFTGFPQPLRNISNASETEDAGAQRKTRGKRKSGLMLAASSAESPAESPAVVARSMLQSQAQGIDVHQTSKRRKLSAGYSDAHASIEIDPSPPAKEATKPNRPAAATPLDDLRKLVHQYTSVPKHQRNTESWPAKEVFDRTGYAVRSAPAAPLVTGAARLEPPAELSREQKLDVFLKFGPDLRRMDACKVSDAKMAADVTQCCPRKVKGGFYKYYHSVTGRKVSPEEFEERYMVMLEEVNHIRSKAWGDYFDSLRNNDNVVIPKNVDEPTAGCGARADVEVVSSKVPDSS